MTLWLKSIVDFFSQPFFIVGGGITVSLVIVGFVASICCWVMGISPMFLRLGRALWGRKIAVFASAAAYPPLKATLTDTNIFREKNVLSVTPDNVDKAAEATVFLVDWETFGSQIETVFTKRSDHQTPIVIYAKPMSIPQDKMSDIANRSNTVVVNFRGRLLNDILTSLMTTSYEKRHT